jgi:hypothetical protein
MRHNRSFDADTTAAARCARSCWSQVIFTSGIRIEAMRIPDLASLLLLVALAPCTSYAADSSKACTIVYGQGRNLSDTDPTVNSMWNRVNDAFNQFVSAELRGAGRRVVTMPHPVEARDKQANFERVIKRAIAEGCGTVVDLSMFADQGASQFVSSMRVLPLLVSPQSMMRRGTNYSLGDEVFTTDRRDPLSKETLDGLSPSTVAREFVRLYLARQAEQGKVD